MSGQIIFASKASRRKFATYYALLSVYRSEIDEGSLADKYNGIETLTSELQEWAFKRLVKMKVENEGLMCGSLEQCLEFWKTSKLNK